MERACRHVVHSKSKLERENELSHGQVGSGVSVEERALRGNYGIRA